MNSENIINKAEILVTPEKVFLYMLVLAEKGFINLDPEDIKEHKRRASFSACYCPYCSVIKTYVRAKIRFKKNDRTDNITNSVFREYAYQCFQEFEKQQGYKARVKSIDFALQNNSLIPI